MHTARRQGLAHDGADGTERRYDTLAVHFVGNCQACMRPAARQSYHLVGEPPHPLKQEPVVVWLRTIVCDGPTGVVAPPTAGSGLRVKPHD